MVGDSNGLVHLIAAVIALIAGTLVLVLRKGTKLHRQVGYVYVISMGVLIVTAFMIYRLFGGWGIFHYSTVLSLLLIGFGMIPVWRKKPINRWRLQHFSFMYWSVIGLYAAFASEILTRVPKTPFLGMVGIATAIILLSGLVYFIRNKPRWIKQFGA